MSEGTRKLEGMKNALRRWAKRLFHRSDKRRSNHSTSNQPLNKTSHPPQETSTGTNATEQHQTPNWPLTTDSHQPSSTLNAQTSSARETQAPFSSEKKYPASPHDSRNEAHDSQLADASVSNNQPQSLGRKPQGTQEGYLKPALKRKAVNVTPSQGSPNNYLRESPYRYLSLEDSSTRHGEANAQSRDEHADGPIATGSDNNAGVGHQGHYTDHSFHPRPAVVHEEIEPHVHTIYEPTRTRSFHLHEHRTLIQPIIDPTSK